MLTENKYTEIDMWKGYYWLPSVIIFLKENMNYTLLS